MRKSVPDDATCPICGRHFDPSESRGWCQNPSCGEWRHPSFPIDGDPDEPESPPESESTRSCPNCGNEVRDDANFCGQCGKPFTESGTPGDSIAECPDCGADLSQVPSDRLSNCPICLFDLTPMLGDSDDTELEQEELTECPNCGEDLSPIPSDMRVVCPGCRVDLEQALEDETDTAEPPEPEETTDIDTLDDIATGYVRRLGEAGITTVEELVRADPNELSASTGISARRIRGWVENAPIEPDDSSPRAEPTEPADTAEGVDLQDTRIQRSPRELVLEVMGREISVTDGQAVGREVRSAMVEAGAPEEDAVYVHRKHVRIDVEDESFYLTRLGENSLEINGQPVDKGARIPIEDGDDISFSDVVTATVSIR